MTTESLTNLVANMQFHLSDLSEKYNNKLMYGLCGCNMQRDMHVLDAFIDVFRCYTLPVDATTSNECLTPTQMQEMLYVVNQICNTSYCADFIQ